MIPASAHPQAHPPLWVGLDLGTSWAKAAVWGADGTGPRLARSRVPMPPVVDGAQDPMAVLAAAERALSDLELSGPVHLALTTQRDTWLAVDATGAPASALLSWRVHPRQGAGREGERSDRGMPLEAWVTGPWVQRRWGAGLGAPGAGPAADIRTLTYAGGDKNCEYWSLGVSPDRPGRAALSLGSAVALGMGVPRTDTAPSLMPGVVASPGHARGHAPSAAPVWHLETGILSGMGGLDLALGMVGLPPWDGPLPIAHAPPAGPAGSRRRLCLTPHFGGALDDPEAQPRLFWDPGGTPVRTDDPDLGPARVARAWAEGVLDELLRLRPKLEDVAGHAITELRVGGGGATAGDWGALLSRGFGVPVEVHRDPWLGCFGAVQIARAMANTPRP
jgi:sugar (pentulose or hexulose) kinase